MVWPYLPLSEALEHVPACAVDAATTVRQATAAVKVSLQNQLFIIVVSSKIDFLGPKASVVPFEGQNAGSRHDWQWRLPDDLLFFS